VILRKYRNIEKAFISKSALSNEFIAANSLFNSVTFRLDKNAATDRFLALRIIKEVVQSLFKKIEIQYIDRQASVAILDNTFDYIDKRVKYVEKLSAEKVKLVISKSKQLGFTSLLGVFQSLVAIIFFSVKAPFVLRNNVLRTNYWLLLKQIPEIINFLAIIKREKIEVVYDFANYEVDSNFLFLLLKERGVHVVKVPSPGPLFGHNRNLLADTLVVCSGYQLEEIKLYKETIRYDKLISFYPELAKLEIKPNVSFDKDKFSVIGFYSHASWLREKHSHSDNGLNLLIAEESLLKTIGSAFVNSEFRLLIFLHPREKKDLEQTKEYYKAFLSNISYEFAPFELKSTECYHLCNLALITLSTILFERIFEGYKILISTDGMIGFPHKNSVLSSICFSSANELNELIEINIQKSNEDFFESNHLSSYTSKIFIPNEYQ
jgi:hypothetical protein